MEIPQKVDLPLRAGGRVKYSGPSLFGQQGWTGTVKRLPMAKARHKGHAADLMAHVIIDGRKNRRPAPVRVEHLTALD